jgi:Mg/Co/Ni transporter MgtE
MEMDQQRYPLMVIPRLINEDTNNKLTREVTQQKIKEALDQMNPDKAPGWTDSLPDSISSAGI